MRETPVSVPARLPSGTGQVLCEPGPELFPTEVLMYARRVGAATPWHVRAPLLVSV